MRASACVSPGLCPQRIANQFAKRVVQGQVATVELTNTRAMHEISTTRAAGPCTDESLLSPGPAVRCSDVSHLLDGAAELWQGPGIRPGLWPYEDALPCGHALVLMVGNRLEVGAGIQFHLRQLCSDTHQQCCAHLRTAAG